MTTLVLTIKEHQDYIQIGSDIKIYCRSNGNYKQTSVKIVAPKEIIIKRKKVLEEIKND